MRIFNLRLCSWPALVSIAAFGLACAPATGKTLKQCNAEYTANKAALEGVQKKPAFMAACRAGPETVPGSAATGAAASPTDGPGLRSTLASSSGAVPAAPGGTAHTSGAKPPPPPDMGQVHKPTAKELAEDRKLKRDMNICIGC